MVIWLELFFQIAFFHLNHFCNNDLFSLPSFMRFFLPSVPIFSQKLSSFSGVLAEFICRGDFGRGEVDAIFFYLTAIAN